MTHRDWFLRGVPRTGFASLCRQSDIGEFVQGEWLFFCVAGQQWCQERPPVHGVRKDGYPVNGHKIGIVRVSARKAIALPTGAPSVGSTIPTAPPLNARPRKWDCFRAYRAD